MLHTDEAGYWHSSVDRAYSPCSISLYKLIHNDIILQIRYRILKTHGFVLTCIILIRTVRVFYGLS